MQLCPRKNIFWHIYMCIHKETHSPFDYLRRLPEHLVTTSTVKQETERKPFPTKWNGMKMSSLSSIAGCIIQNWLNLLLHWTNLINTLSPTDFLRRLLRFNELNLKLSLDNMDMGISQDFRKKKKIQKTVLGKKWTQIYLRIWCSMNRKQ